MTVLPSPVPPHTGAYTRKRPASIRHPTDVQRTLLLRLQTAAAAAPPPEAVVQTSEAENLRETALEMMREIAAERRAAMKAAPEPVKETASDSVQEAGSEAGVAPKAATETGMEAATEAVKETGTEAVVDGSALRTCTVSKCAFCRISLGASPAEVLHRDSEFLVIRDSRPAAEHHYLVMPLNHTPDVKHVTADDLPMLRRMEVLGLRVLEEQGAPMGDLRLGFHVPPFQSVGHLHLHCIAPASQMGYFNRTVAFRQDSFCFVSMDRLLARLLCE